MPFSALAFVLYPSLVVMISPFPAFRRNRNSPRACTGSWCRGCRPGCRCVWLPEKQAERLDGLRQRFSEKMVDIFKTYEVPLPG